MSDRDFGRYNCTARNNIGVRYQEFILAQAGESAELPLLCGPFAWTNEIGDLIWSPKGVCGVMDHTPFESLLSQ